MEKLFSKDEVNEILHEANTNMEFYLGTTVANGEATEISIITITEGNNLIFTEGNDDTGYRHLSDRHNLFSYKNYWVKTNNEQVRLDDPSKFHPRMMPIIDYVKVADAIFKPENKNITKNNHPVVFDKYTGTYGYQGEPQEKYHLLTYKDTKIVHTLFPDKKRHNGKSKVKFGKGTVTITTKFPEGYNDLLLPYENNQGIAAYSILLRKYYEEQIERGYIQIHDVLGEPEFAVALYERKFESFERFEHEDMNYFQNSDLTDYEKLISKIDEAKKKGSLVVEDEDL